MIARFLAAVSFAALVLLAVGTAGVRIASWRLRSRLERYDYEVRSLRYESVHTERAMSRAVTREALTQALAATLERHRS